MHGGEVVYCSFKFSKILLRDDYAKKDVNITVFTVSSKRVILYVYFSYVSDDEETLHTRGEAVWMHYEWKT